MVALKISSRGQLCYSLVVTDDLFYALRKVCRLAQVTLGKDVEEGTFTDAAKVGFCMSFRIGTFTGPGQQVLTWADQRYRTSKSYRDGRGCTADKALSPLRVDRLVRDQQRNGR